ncbi:MAG TPA: glycerol-3-phosphate dehydrogenase, partial [Rhodocyclaceae bacterium]|nr:glycerol-3-phosphate dehydrogenase [Rhodocyclaceae bacterium]
MSDHSNTHYDLAVIGGGINGAGVARDAAGRGLKVLLCERDDLAQHTSSSSTKLIHGGLRYLEHLEFSLVRKALAEREILLRAAPHIISPLRFVMPHDTHLRPVWMIRLGLFFYDHLARRVTSPASRFIDLRRHPAGAALQTEFRDGFEYSDAWADDARLVVLNCVDAAQRGATILPRTECITVEREEELWNLRLQVKNGDMFEVTARAVVNAAGPWVERFLDERSPVRARHSVRLVKGSHIVVRKLFDHPYAYIFQNPDKRIVFAIPYEGDFTLIGTTDIEEHGNPSDVAIDAEETRYLCSMVNRYFQRSITSSDIVWSYSGVRPLLEDENS